jgi:DNA polymerase-3 subunit epsilon
MLRLYLDTETSGFPRKDGTPLDQCPHIVQLAALLIDDEDGELAMLDAIVRPDGWVIPEDVVAVHGITTARAVAEGVPIAAVMRCFLHMYARADELVAHNLKFDLKIIGYELARMREGWPGIKRRFCTMEAAAPIIKRAGSGYQYKLPKLIEAHQHFLGEGFDGAHGAMADTRACARVHRHMIDNKLI